MPSQEQQILLLSTLIQLEQQARRASTGAEFSFVVVNETHRLIEYRQAILWRQRIIGGKPRIEAVSGTDRLDRNAPYLSYIRELLLYMDGRQQERTCCLVSIDELPERLRPGFQEWLNCFVLWCPLVTVRGDEPGGLLLLGEKAWDEAQIAVFERLAEAYAHTWLALTGRRPNLLRRGVGLSRKLFFQITVIAVLLLVCDQPVRLSVLAPVEIVPIDPYIVSAPINGVVSEFHVTPNQTVKEGQLLFSLDDTTLRNDFEVSRKGLAVIRTEYQRMTQQAFADQQSRGQVRHLEAEMARKKAEVRYMEELLEKAQIRAGRGGIAVFADTADWLGKPVVVGEKVLSLADPTRVGGDVWLPVEDAINLEPGAEVLIFLNISPDKPLSAVLSQAAYEAVISPEGILSFRLRVSLNASSAEALPRIGLRGTAKIYGKSVPLYYYLLRRPLITLRQTLGI